MANLPKPLVATPSVAARFWAMVRRDTGGRSCWEWTGARDPKGYGRFSLYRKCRLSHRVAYALAYGAVPPKHLMHTCDNPSCCNPIHLVPGTLAENNADMMRKGRFRAGIRNTEKVACIHGHPFTEENTYRHRGKRDCKTCRAASSKRAQERMRASNGRS